MQRRLAAVLIADVVGYGRLSQSDEEGTRAHFQADLREVFEPAIAAHRGRLVNTMGDGLLVEFQSVVDALRCGVAVQRAKAERNAVVAATDRLEFRIGVNLGDVIVEGEDIHGDGVNIADRMQTLAEPGGIAISGAAYDQVKAKFPVGYASLGEQHVKSIAEPVRVYRVLLDPAAAGKTFAAVQKRTLRWPPAAAAVLLLATAAALALWRPWEKTVERAQIERVALADKPSIAVLPFLNMSGDKEQEFFADGLTEDLIVDLSNLSGLFVISRNTAFSYKGQTLKPQQIARELGITYLLNGSVRRSAARVRVTAELLDAVNDRPLWAGRFDRELTDVFTVQDEVKREIIAALEVSLTPAEEGRAETAPTTNIEAYEYFLRGRYAKNLLTRRALRLAYYAFEKAVALDPNFAEAYAELAMTYALDLTGTNNAWNDWVRSPGRARLQAEILARKAAALNRDLAAPDLVLARLALAEWRYDDALAHARRAVEREPANSETHTTLALTLTATGQHEEAKRAIDEALRRDPKAVPSTHATLGIIQFALRDYETAAETLERSFEEMVDGGNWFFGMFLIAAAEMSREKRVLEGLRKNLSLGISLAAARFTQFYRDSDDMEHLLSGLREAGVPEFPAELNLKEEAAEPLVGSALVNLLDGRDFETLCWNPRLNGEFRFASDGSFTWSVRHDLTDTGKSRIGDKGVCVTMPVMTRNRETCYSVFKIEGDNQLIRDYEYVFAGPMLCYFREKLG